MLIGCSTVTSRQTFIACKTADIITTYHLVNRGNAIEANPLLNNTIKNGWITFFIFQGLVTWFLLRPDVNNKTLNIINIPTCGAAVWNFTHL